MKMVPRWFLAATAATVAVVTACCAVASADPPAAGVSRVTPVVLAYRRARPAVVNISAKKVVRTRWGLFGSDPFDEIFPDMLSRRVPIQSLGSGVVIHGDGYIVTNAHVVRQAVEIIVVTPDKIRLAAKVISTEVKQDLAVLKVSLPAGKKLPRVPLGRSDDLMVGETVIAIGNPMGYANTLTTGVISAVDRKLTFSGGVTYAGLIQTDAPINPGNSGGPLLNIRGELIGINTAIRGDAQNIGFAIPVDTMADTLSSLLDFEKINRVVFGASIKQRHTESGDELYVSAVRKGTPADGKLRAGDRLLSLDATPVKQIPDYVCALLEAKAGTTVRLGVRRDGRDLAVAVPILAKPRPDGSALASAMLGLAVRPLTPQMAQSLRLSVDRGLLVVQVEQGGPAERLGVRLRDVLFQVDRFYVSSVDGLGMVLENVKAGETIKIGLVRGNVRALAGIRVRDPKTKPPPSGRPI